MLPGAGWLPEVRGLELSAPSQASGERRRALRWRSITNDWWFHQSCLCNGTPIKPMNDGVWRASGFVNTPRCWEGGMIERTWKIHALFLPGPHPSNPYLTYDPSVSVPELYSFFSRPVIISKLFSCVLWAILTNYWTWAGGRGKPWIIACWSEVQVTTWEWAGQSCGTELLICGVCANAR